MQLEWCTFFAFLLVHASSGGYLPGMLHFGRRLFSQSVIASSRAKVNERNGQNAVTVILILFLAFVLSNFISFRTFNRNWWQRPVTTGGGRSVFSHVFFSGKKYWWRWRKKIPKPMLEIASLVHILGLNGPPQLQGCMKCRLWNRGQTQHETLLADWPVVGFSSLRNNFWS